MLESFILGSDDIFYCPDNSLGESDEISFRTNIAKDVKGDFLKIISKSHSIPVMDAEIRRFLKSIPRNGIILDIGGCWGWHWRNIDTVRPDVSVVVVDFVHSNLMHAKNFLGDLINKNIYLAHGDATNLKFSSELFDGIWTVQCLQHIENFEAAVFESFRVMKLEAVFANYSFNIQPQVKFFKNLLRKPYIINGFIMGDKLWLSRASSKQKLHLEKVFQDCVHERWSEYLFSPALGICAPGKEDHWLGRLDAKLTNNCGFMRWFARQHSFHVMKSKNVNCEYG